MEEKVLLEAYAVNTLIDKGNSQEMAFDLVDKRFLKLSYNTGAMEVSQVVMLDENNIFYGVDVLGRFVAGKFIDDRYIVFYIANKDKSITRFIGYNSVDFISIQFVNTNVCTGMEIKKIPTTEYAMAIDEIYKSISEAIKSTDPNLLAEFMNEIKEYQEYVDGIRTIRIKLGLDEEAPVIKELK